eukprot:6226555-Pyramimonas_sp.AAC.1
MSRLVIPRKQIRSTSPLVSQCATPRRGARAHPVRVLTPWRPQRGSQEVVPQRALGVPLDT